MNAIQHERGDAMKRWIIIAILVIAAVAIAMSWNSLHIPSSQSGIVSAADIGLLLLDTGEGVSVLGVQDNSVAEQANIHPGDLLLHLNGSSLNTVDMLNSLLIKGNEETLLIDLQRGKNIFSVKISLASIIH